MLIYFDLLLITILFFHLVREKEFMLLNPSLIYLFIHVSFVSYRGVQVFIWDKEIVSNAVYDSIVTQGELETAIVLADIGLLSFFIGFNIFKNRLKKKGFELQQLFPYIVEKNKRLLAYYIKIIVLLGLVGLVFFAYIPGRGKNVYEASMLTEMLANLSIISALVLIFQQGFNKKNTVFFFVLVLIYLVQGYARFRAVLPLVFVMLYYLKLYEKNFPPSKYVLIGALFFLVSIPAKQVGLNLREGNSVDFTEVIKDSFTEVTSGESGEMALIEQSAAMIGNMQNMNKVFYGKTYSSILFFFVPKTWWPEKPALNEWQHEISDAGRQFGEMGQISTIIGEAYANFRIPGIIVVMMLLGLFYGYLFYVFMPMPLKHRGFLLLLLFNMLLFQVWRDGLISLFLFPLLNYLPITILYFLKKHPKLIAKATTDQ